ncbi:MAG TPA: N-acetyltransferase [Propionibacterium sp.]|jgi:predicted GNAT family acetyltransferase|nr:N-acetyltransferase [Propionibacterium sp.]
MTEVQDNEDKSRFEILVDGDVAGFVDYELGTDVITMTHTEVDDAYSGQGLGKKVVAEALEQARTRGVSVRPVCPLVRKIIAEDTENNYLDLVRLPDREEFDLPS